MTHVLVLLETRGGNLRTASLEAVGAARKLADATGGGTVIALAAEKADLDAVRIGGAGADKLLTSAVEAHSADSAAATAARVAKEEGVGAVLLVATARGRDICGRLAAHLETGFLADCVDFEVAGDQVHFTRPVYAGKARIKVAPTGSTLVASLRPNFFAPAGRSATAEVSEVTMEAAKAQVTSISGEKQGRPDVAEAGMIISGGHGMGEAENWGILEAVADAVPGMATGASRRVVDLGWRPHDEQVGQTGKTVSPELYIAAGISGAIQHLAGMSTSKVIVAINKDSGAPIFEVADFGIVGDVNEVLPVLAEELKKIQG